MCVNIIIFLVVPEQPRFGVHVGCFGSAAESNETARLGRAARGKVMFPSVLVRFDGGVCGGGVSLALSGKQSVGIRLLELSSLMAARLLLPRIDLLKGRGGVCGWHWRKRGEGGSYRLFLTVEIFDQGTRISAETNRHADAPGIRGGGGGGWNGIGRGLCRSRTITTHGSGGMCEIPKHPKDKN